MSMEKMLTIVVPVYNVQKYIYKCVDSILSQTYKNIEVILVDDGSPDECGTICDKYAEKDKRVRVIHKKNGGLSSARNSALDIANGDYVGFVDSDDWIEPTMYEEMVQFLEDENCDMVECAINNVIDDKKTIISDCGKEVLSGREALMRRLDTIKHFTMPRPSVWSKLYRGDFWKNKRFPEGKIHEDYFLTCMALYEANRVGLIHKGLYNHLKNNPSSICNTKFSKRDLYRRNQCEYIVDYLADKADPELYEMALISYFCYLVTAIWKCDQNGLKDEAAENIRIVQSHKKLIKGLHFSWKKRIDLYLIVFFPYLFLFFRRALSSLRNLCL